MGENSKIAWTDHTFNPWWGCAKVSEACRNCYAEAVAARFGTHWGPDEPRRFFGEKHWAEPLKWNRKAEREGKRSRVFCGSMCDVFEAGSEEALLLDAQRQRLWKLIAETPCLDWLLLTKRPENIRRMLPTIQIGGEELPRFDNIWLGVTVENQAVAEARIRDLLLSPAAVRFASVEPLLGALDLTMVNDGSWYDGEGAQLYDVLRGHAYYRDGEHGLGGGPKLDWVIVGGESGPSARPCNVEWIRSIVRRCGEAGVPVFAKQLGANCRARNDENWTCDDEPDFPAWPAHLVAEDRLEDNPNGFREQHQGAPVRVHFRDRAGADPSEWPDDLRVRQFPPGVAGERSQ